MNSGLAGEMCDWQVAKDKNNAGICVEVLGMNREKHQTSSLIHRLRLASGT
jgi:hypothetical protein